VLFKASVHKTDLHPSLQASCVAVPGRGGCYAVVPLPAPVSVDVPACWKLFVAARQELDRLAAAIIRNREHAELLMAMLNRREAVDSSQIEGTRTGFDGLLIHELEASSAGATENPDAAETLAYLRAYMAGATAVEKHGVMVLGRPLICSLHQVLMQGHPKSMPGQFRDVQNYIGLRLETARYVPPPPAEVPRLMDDLTSLLRYEPEGVMSVSVLMRAAIAHVQFEAIHPFRDGNGRIGRLLLPLMFAADGQPPIHMATFLKVRQQAYYDALFVAQTRLEWEPWIRLFLECVIASARHTTQLFDVLAAIRNRWHALLASQNRRKDAAAWRIIDLLVGKPIVSVPTLARQLGVSFQAANTAVEELERLEIIRRTNERRRNRLYQAHEVTNALYTGLDRVLEDAEQRIG
jgi:Fic family protein